MNTINGTEQLKKLDQKVRTRWEAILAQPQTLNFADSLMGTDRRVYGLYLTQVYHYTYHTPRNQALVAVNLRNTDVKYMQFCLEHALEETGHDLMALHDLRNLGVKIEDPHTEMPPPLPATELLIAYLYWVASFGSPVQRLGYSYWAEGSYDLIAPFIQNMAGGMQLTKKEMSFYHNHAHIDDKHARDVEQALLHICKTEDDWKQVEKVAMMTIDLTERILHEVLEEYQKLIDGESPDYVIVNSLELVNPEK